MPGSSGDRGGAAGVLPASWRVHVASAIGASHVRDGLPNQDAAAGTLVELPDGTSVTVAAVADGHGDARHFRSDRGAHFAVTEGLAAVADWVRDLPATPAEAGQRARALLVPDVVARWDAAVAADIASDPLPADRADGHQLTSIAYGSTLMLTVISAGWAVLTQIGDGDMLAVLPDGQAISPVPDDPNLDGRRTTSLCQVGAVDSFRVATIDLTDSQLFAVLSGTDGFGNAQAEERWQGAVAADLVRFTIEGGPDWISNSLPGWAKQCASSAGSGDDCTVALVVNGGAQLTTPTFLPPMSQHDAAGQAKTVRLTPTTMQLGADAADAAALAASPALVASEDITVPVPRSGPADGWSGASPPTQRVPAPPPAGQPSGPPPGVPPQLAGPSRQRPSRTGLIAAAAVVVVVAAVVGIALALHHGPAAAHPPRHSTTPTPSVSGSRSPRTAHHHGHNGGTGGSGVGGGQSSGAKPSPSKKGHTVSVSVTVTIP